AKNTHPQFGPSGSHEPRQPDNFALTDSDIDVCAYFAVLVDGVIHIPVAHFKYDLSNVRFPRWKAVGQVTANHTANNPVFGNLVFVAIQSLDRGAVPQNRNRIGNFRDLV